MIGASPSSLASSPSPESSPPASPSRVLHVRHVGGRDDADEDAIAFVTEAVRAAGAGDAQEVRLSSSGGIAFVQMATVEAARRVIEHVRQRPVSRGGRALRFQFSLRSEMSPSARKKAPPAAAAPPAGPGRVVLITLAGGGESEQEQAGLGELYEAAAPHGSVLRMVTFVKGRFQKALVEFSTPEGAAAAIAALHGSRLGGMSVSALASVLPELEVRVSGRKARDFTRGDAVPVPFAHASPGLVSPASGAPRGSGPRAFTFAGAAAARQQAHVLQPQPQPPRNHQAAVEGAVLHGVSGLHLAGDEGCPPSDGAGSRPASPYNLPCSLPASPVCTPRSPPEQQQQHYQQQQQQHYQQQQQQQYYHQQQQQYSPPMPQHSPQHVSMQQQYEHHYRQMQQYQQMHQMHQMHHMHHMQQLHHLAAVEQAEAELAAAAALAAGRPDSSPEAERARLAAAALAAARNAAVSVVTPLGSPVRGAAPVPVPVPASSPQHHHQQQQLQQQQPPHGGLSPVSAGGGYGFVLPDAMSAGDHAPASAHTGSGAGGGAPPWAGRTAVLHVSGLVGGEVTPEVLYRLCGTCGDVLRVKIMYTRPDKALVQFVHPYHAYVAESMLNGCVLFGSRMSVVSSRHDEVAVPRRDASAQAHMMTRDFSTRHGEQRFADGSNFQHVCRPGDTLFLAGLPEGATEESVRATFSAPPGQLAGSPAPAARRGPFSVLDVEFFSNRRMALVRLASPADAVDALVKFHNTVPPGFGGLLVASFSHRSVDAVRAARARREGRAL